ncbi:MAG: DUF4190 domain-containing protein [Actinobacteria bacterium]|nr:DUF4190 domain-containing protein [Actinomycetota bacterium]
MSGQPAAGWYADPTGRFDHRYWDGATWTGHVSRNGQATTDPLDGSRTPTDTGTIAETSPAVATQTGPPGSTGSERAWEASGGSGPSWQTQATSGTRTNTKAIVSLVLSIIWFGGLTSIPAVVLGVMARREIRERPDEGGAGIAMAGIIIGLIGVVGAVLILVAILAFVSMGSGPMFMDMG